MCLCYDTQLKLTKSVEKGKKKDRTNLVYNKNRQDIKLYINLILTCGEIRILEKFRTFLAPRKFKSKFASRISIIVENINEHYTMVAGFSDLIVLGNLERDGSIGLR